MKLEEEKPRAKASSLRRGSCLRVIFSRPLCARRAAHTVRVTPAAAIVALLSRGGLSTKTHGKPRAKVSSPRRAARQQAAATCFRALRKQVRVLEQQLSLS